MVELVKLLMVLISVLRLIRGYRAVPNRRYTSLIQSRRLPLSLACDASGKRESNSGGGDGSANASQGKKVIRIKRSLKKKTESTVPKEIGNDGRYVTMQLGSDEDVQAAEMDDRLQAARGWVSKKLSDEDAALLNRAMGIEAEVLAALEAEEDEDLNTSKGRRLMESAETPTKKKGKKKEGMIEGKRMYDKFTNDKQQAAAMVKGFLEMNPYVCSGCGAPFQKKSPDTPGYLPADKLAAHRANAGRIKDKQEAIRILEMAGIEIDSEEAADILRDADVSEDVISGVRALGQAGMEGNLYAHDNDFDDEDDLLFEDGQAGLLDDLSNEDRGTGSWGAVGKALMHKERIRELSGEAEKEEGAAVISDNDDDDYDALDGLEIDLEDLLISLDGAEADGKEKSVSQALMTEFAKAASSSAPLDDDDEDDILEGFIAEEDEEEEELSVKERYLRDGLLINDIDAEANPASGQNNAWREYSKALESGITSMDTADSDVDVDYEDFGAESALAAMSGRVGQEKDVIMSNPIDEAVCVCQRCYRLQTYGQVEQQLRPGWSDHDLLTPEHFQNLLSSVRETDAVVLCLVDLFDLEGSILKNLKHIAGPNPIVIAANKADLLPKDVSEARLTNWIHSEVRRVCKLKSPRENEMEVRAEREDKGWTRRKADDEEGVLRRSNIHLVSCANGLGMRGLLNSVMGMAADNGNRVYVMGAANVGKSSFINNLLEDVYEKGGGGNGNKKMKGRRKNKSTPQATVSNLPGTTLNFLNIRLPNGITMVDTPGLLNEGQLTTKLTTEELRQVIPVTPINPVTFRCGEGKSVMIGGLAQVEVLEGLPFFLTFFISNEIKLHPTSAEKANDPDWVQRHTGTLVTPPSSVERLNQIGPMESQVFEIYGEGWKSAASDIVIAGLGWVSITGAGPCVIKVTAPAGTSISVRDALLPYEASHSTAKFTGGKIMKKSRKQGKQSYGWRAGSF